MKRYIDANNIRLTGLTFTDVNNEVYFSLTDVRKAIEQTPTENVEEVRHGKWKLGRSGLMYFCDKCGYAAHPREQEEWGFCPRCGAKMDGERREQE